MKVGSLIKKNRIAQNLSVTALAEEAGISQAYLSQIETGSKPTPSEAVLTRIARALTIPAGILLAAKGDKMEQPTDEISLFLGLQQLLETALRDMKPQPTENALAEWDYWNEEKFTKWKQVPAESLGEVNQILTSLEQKLYPPDMQLLISEMLLLSESERDFLGEVILALKKNLRSHNQPV